MATGDLLTAAKAKYGALLGAAVGFVAPGVTYLLENDSNGITGQEWLHALLLSVAFAGGGAVAVGSVVYAVENKPKPGVLLGEAKLAGDVDEGGPDADDVPPTPLPPL